MYFHSLAGLFFCNSVLKCTFFSFYICTAPRCGWCLSSCFRPVLTLRCSWSWAWCWRVNFSCCFWNSLMSNCFWICCCFWMRKSSCCSCLSHIPGSEPGPSILKSVRRSKGDNGSTAKGTSGLMSTVVQKQKRKEWKRKLDPSDALLDFSFSFKKIKGEVLIFKGQCKMLRTNIILKALEKWSFKLEFISDQIDELKASWRRGLNQSKLNLSQFSKTSWLFM